MAAPAAARRPQPCRRRHAQSGSGKPRPSRARSKKGEMEAVDAEAVDARLKSLGSRRPRSKKKPLELELQAARRRRRHRQGHPHLHPAVRDDDRRRSAAGAVPRHPRQPDGQRRLQEGDLRDQGARSSRGSTFADALKEHPKVFDELYVQLVRRRRGGRYPRHHPQPARGLPREGGEAEAQGQGRDDLPGHRHRAWRSASPRCCCSRSPRCSRRCSRTSARRCPAPTQFVIDISNWLQNYIIHLVGRHRRASSSRFSAFYRNPKGREICDKLDPQGADLRRRHPQGRGGALHPHAGHDDQLRRAHPRRARRHGEDRRQPHRRGGASTTSAARSPRARTSPARCWRRRCSRPWWCR